MSGRPGSAQLVHPALFYRSDAEYQAKIVPFVTTGLKLGQPVAVAVPGQRPRQVRDALGRYNESLPARDGATVEVATAEDVGAARRFASSAAAGSGWRVTGSRTWRSS